MSRRHPRVRTRLTATVRVDARMIVCPTRDVSAAGCFLETADDIPLGTEIGVAVMDLVRGEVLEITGTVCRRVMPNAEGDSAGLGVQVHDPPEGWELLVERVQAASGPIGGVSTGRLRILVVGDEKRRRGALALYVTSGWDVRFAEDLEAAMEALAAVQLSAVIAEHELDDQRWTDVLAATRTMQPTARRIVRCNLHGKAAPETDPAVDLVHRVVDLDAGMDALLDALTADFGF
ncbi:MAG TPA: PilZ domain-containing protein [Kofleriaceae bacterium]|nr:PilZ domain-containing protein [Kofleriaceae bacterium]